jgi:hypothetical protein
MEEIKSWMGREKYERWRKEKGFYASTLYAFPLTSIYNILALEEGEKYIKVKPDVGKME